MIADYLGDNEITVTTLPSGREIDEVMKRETIDLLVLDLRMPGENGCRSHASCARIPSFRSSC